MLINYIHTKIAARKIVERRVLTLSVGLPFFMCHVGMISCDSMHVLRTEMIAA